MPQESIGVCGTQSDGSDWNIAELEIGICYIKHSCGDPPPGFDLEIVWNEHELGDYPMIGLSWDHPSDAPWEYISRAERALERLNDAVQWSELEPEENGADQEEDDAENQQGADVQIEESLLGFSRDGGHATAGEAVKNRSQAFVPADQLPFNVAQTVQSAIADWEVTKSAGISGHLDDSVGDFIAAEMESLGLRSLNGETAWFSAQSGQDEFRKCVFAALDRWLMASETLTKRSPEETANYIRPLGE